MSCITQHCSAQCTDAPPFQLRQACVNSEVVPVFLTTAGALAAYSTLVGSLGFGATVNVQVHAHLYAAANAAMDASYTGVLLALAGADPESMLTSITPLGAPAAGPGSATSFTVRLHAACAPHCTTSQLRLAAPGLGALQINVDTLPDTCVPPAEAAPSALLAQAQARRRRWAGWLRNPDLDVVGEASAAAHWDERGQGYSVQEVAGPFQLQRSAIHTTSLAPAGQRGATQVRGRACAATSSAAPAHRRL